jgi:hypothetical protein
MIVSKINFFSDQLRRSALVELRTERVLRDIEDITLSGQKHLSPRTRFIRTLMTFKLLLC